MARRTIEWTAALLPLALLACAEEEGRTGDPYAETPAGGSGGTGNAGASGGTGGNGGSAGTHTEPTCNLYPHDNGKPEGMLAGDVSANRTLTRDKNWLLKGKVKVQPGVTLTIEPCTTIMGDLDTLGTLIVQRGAKLVAKGTQDEPILFTSLAEEGEREPGQWGGLILLGAAPNNKGTDVAIEGLSTNEPYGGDRPDDSSGELSYVRIEYSGVEIGDGNEINGLTMGSVGSGTKLDHIMVANTLDDCFEWFGGTVNATHLVCHNAGDDMFDMDQGYVGRLQFLYGVQNNPLSDDPNGFECDNNKTTPTLEPRTNPTVFNTTLCGVDPGAQSDWGAVFRRGALGTFGNIALTGFEGGISLRDAPHTEVHMTHSVVYGGKPSEPADWFTGKTDNLLVAGPLDCSNPGRPVAATQGRAGTPPSSFTKAEYVGAFKSGESWLDGLWTDFATK